MEVVSIVLAVAAFLVGLKAARDWYVSSQIVPDPGWSVEPGELSLSQMGWLAALMEASSKSAELNRTAALWTAWSVGLSAAASIAGNLSWL
jgi:hypothetical protein